MGIQNDVIARAYARLRALRKNIAEMEARVNVEEKYVHEFHAVLTNIESVGIDMSEFRLPDSEVGPRVTTRHVGGDVTYSNDKYVDKPFILAKLDAILNYFEIIISDEKPREIGFRASDGQ